MLVYTGIDWSESKHDIVFMNQTGAVIAQLTVPHTLEGFLKLDAARARLGVSPGDCVVGLETAHNLLIDFLWSRQYAHIFVIPPSVVKGNRTRFGQSGARTDLSDALLLAEVLRTDRGRVVSVGLKIISNVFPLRDHGGNGVLKSICGLLLTKVAQHQHGR